MCLFPKEPSGETPRVEGVLIFIAVVLHLYCSCIVVVLHLLHLYCNIAGAKFACYQNQRGQGTFFGRTTLSDRKQVCVCVSEGGQNSQDWEGFMSPAGWDN